MRRLFVVSFDFDEENMTIETHIDVAEKVTKDIVIQTLEEFLEFYKKETEDEISQETNNC